jgi:hypothetical protein
MPFLHLALNAKWHVGCIEEASCVCKAEANIVVEQGPYSLVLPTSDVASIHVCSDMYMQHHAVWASPIDYMTKLVRRNPQLKGVCVSRFVVLGAVAVVDELLRT